MKPRLATWTMITFESTFSRLVRFKLKFSELTMLCLAFLYTGVCLCQGLPNISTLRYWRKSRKWISGPTNILRWVYSARELSWITASFSDLKGKMIEMLFLFCFCCVISEDNPTKICRVRPLLSSSLIRLQPFSWNEKFLPKRKFYHRNLYTKISSRNNLWHIHDP